jgi:hypothetical protein
MDSSLERATEQAGEQRAQRGCPEVRRLRGIVHTPPPLARFGVRAADEALRGALDRPAGIADPNVALLDPACGPGAFLAGVLAEGAPRPERPRMLLGIDRDPTALRAAREVLAGPAAGAGWPLRFRRADTLASLRPWGRHAVGPGATLVVIGNPPWASRSANRNAAATGTLLEDFRRGPDGEPLGERKIGVLSDDYVRFWRWAAELARGASAGAVVALVTNASFVDGPIHRGMRAALLGWFDGLDVLDLGGGSLVAREAGQVDESLFGVRPSVALTVAWRRGGEDAKTVCQVRWTKLRGRRRDKLDALGGSWPSQWSWQRLDPGAPAFLLRPGPQVPGLRDAVSLAELMPFHREGIQTNRDAVAIATDPHVLLGRLRAFAEGSEAPELEGALRASGHYDPVRARHAVADALARDPHGAEGVSIRPIAYRPFDVRWFAPVPPLCHRPRPSLVASMQHGGLALLTVRKDRGQRAWTHFGAAAHAPDNCWLSTRSSCRTRAFPACRPDGRPNLDPAVASRWSERVDEDVQASGVLRYALAILASPTYRKQHDAALRLDYPRIPPPTDSATWRAVVAAGEQLVQAFCPARDPVFDGGPLQVGHVQLSRAPTPLHEAIQRADRCVAPLFEDGSREPGACP